MSKPHNLKGELRRLALVMAALGVILVVALYWVWIRFTPLPFLCCLANVAAWGLWYFVLDDQLSRHHYLLARLERRFGGPAKLQKRMKIVGLLSSMAIAGVPAFISYAHATSVLGCLQISVTAVLGAVVFFWTVTICAGFTFVFSVARRSGGDDNLLETAD